VFEKRALRIFESKTEVMGSWRKLHNYQLHNLHSSPSIIRMIKSRRMRWGGHVVRMREKRNAYRLLVGIPEWKGLLRKPRRRWLGNINMDRREIGWGGMDLIDMVQNRDQWCAFAKTVINLRPL
jgi:hypothetical protein